MGNFSSEKSHLLGLVRRLRRLWIHRGFPGLERELGDVQRGAVRHSKVPLPHGTTGGVRQEGLCRAQRKRGTSANVLGTTRERGLPGL